MSRSAYSYRTDPEVPDFDDERPLFVFDNVCVLCSSGASFLMRHDPSHRIAFTSAQGDVGRALYRHYGLELDESYLFLAHGRAFTMSDGYLALVRELGGWWRVLLVGRLVPRPVRDAIYRSIARNRYRWFGKTQACALLSDDQRSRLL